MAYALDDTIYALSTPSGVGALGVIRVTGPQALAISSTLFKGPHLERVASHTAHFGRIVADGRIVDEVVAVVFKGPRSFTGQDTVEFSCHGSPYILSKVMEALGKAGARLAQPGEFTLRAFMHGKMDLSQAEAVADLIASEHEAAHRVAMHQMRGGFSEELQALREQLIHFAALVELELDFAEEDVEFADRSNLRALVASIVKVLTQLESTFALGNAIKNGVPVAIVGAPNAGKSTLLNALLNEERALVSHIAGTTRDTIEDEIHIGGLAFRFIDTAGIRQTDDVVESMGIARSKEKIRQARIVLHLLDAGTPVEERNALEAEVLREAGTTPVLTLLTKADLYPRAAAQAGEYLISAKTGLGLEALQEQLVQMVQGASVGADQTIVSNARHQEALLRAHEAIVRLNQAMDAGLTSDLLAEDLRLALFHLGEITGQVVPDDVLGAIFSKFCIGK
jgi:tRNA modification GTPase